MRQKGFALLIIILVIAILGVIGYFVYKDYSAKLQTPIQTGVSSTTSQTPDPLAAVKEPYKSIFSGVSKIFSENLDSKVQIIYQADGQMYWPVSNGALAAVNSSPTIQIQSLCNEATSDSDSVFANKMDITLAKLNTYFLANNFTRTSSPAFLKTPFSQSGVGIDVGYQNDVNGLRCILTFSSSCGGDNTNSSFFKSGALSCDTLPNITTAAAPQLDYLLALGTPGNTLDIISQYGDFYNFNENSLIGPGASIIAEKSATGWINVYSGQDIISCDLVNKYKVPHQLKGAEKCYDSASQQTINNPN